MEMEALRKFCLGLPGTTEEVQWEDHLLFKVGGKMYAITSLSPVGPRLSFKSTPEEAAELVERDGLIPAAYLAKHHWVSLERWDALTGAELKRLVAASYELVKAKLPKKVRASLVK